MSVSGLRVPEGGSNANVRWFNGPLRIGDEITIAVVDVSEPDISRAIEEKPAAKATESSDWRYQTPDEPPMDLRVHVGGLRKSAEGVQAHVQWLERRLEVGDVMTISVVDVPESDISAPIKETTAAELTEKGERAELAHLMEKYGAP